MRDNHKTATLMETQFQDIKSAYNHLAGIDSEFEKITRSEFRNFELNNRILLRHIENYDPNYNAEDRDEYDRSFQDLIGKVSDFYRLDSDNAVFHADQFDAFHGGAYRMHKLALTGGVDRQMRIIKKRHELGGQIPEEVIAPIQVLISNGRVEASSYKTKKGQVPDASLEDAKSAAHVLLSGALRQLSDNTNSDPRLLEVCSILNNSISHRLESTSIVTVGVYCEAVEGTFAVTRETVPDAAIPQLDKVIKIIKTLLSQFEEWGTYKAAESAAQLQPKDLIELARDTNDIKDEIEKSPEVFDQEIAARLSGMSLIIAQGVARSESIAPALVGSINNILGPLSHVVFDYTTNLGIHLIGIDAATIKAGVGAVGLLVAAINILTKVIPVLTKYEPFKWLSVVGKEIGDSISQFRELMDIFK